MAITVEVEATPTFMNRISFKQFSVTLNYLLKTHNLLIAY